VCALLDLLEAMLPKRGWEIRWHSRGFEPAYRDKAKIHTQLGRRHVNLRVGAPPTIDDDGQKRGMFPWHAAHLLRVESPDDLTDEFRKKLKQLLAQAEDLTNRHLAQQEKQRRPSRR